MKKLCMVKPLVLGMLVLCVAAMVSSTAVIFGEVRATPSIHAEEPTLKASSAALQTTWTVDDEPGDGDFTTITAAVSAATDGDTIEVYSGTYPENVVVTKHLTFTGIDHELGTGSDTGKPVVDSPIYDCFQIWVGHVTIQGFAITGGRAGIYILGYDSHRILNNTITLNQVGIWLNSTSDGEIRNNAISQNTQYGIYLYPSDGNTIEGNRIENNALRGIWIVEGSQNTVFNNYFNNVNNARDDGTGNVWFINPISGTNINGGPLIGGNWWSDFLPKPWGGLFPSSPPLDYHVSGSAGSVDQHPLPGFEVLAFVAALVIALLVLRTKKRG